MERPLFFSLPSSSIHTIAPQSICQRMDAPAPRLLPSSWHSSANTSHFRIWRPVLGSYEIGMKCSSRFIGTLSRTRALSGPASAPSIFDLQEPLPRRNRPLCTLTKYGLHIRHPTITCGLTVSICAKALERMQPCLAHCARRPATRLVSAKRAPREDKGHFEKAIRRYGYLFPSGHQRHVLLHTPSVY